MNTRMRATLTVIAFSCTTAAAFAAQDPAAKPPTPAPAAPVQQIADPNIEAAMKALADKANGKKAGVAEDLSMHHNIQKHGHHRKRRHR